PCAMPRRAGASIVSATKCPRATRGKFINGFGRRLNPARACRLASVSCGQSSMASENLPSPLPENKSGVLLPDHGMRMMERRADKTADTRERIERAALKHFVEQGIAETSIRDIADEARISLGAMYNHFKSKEELAWQLFINGWNEFGDALSRCEAGQPDLPSKLRAMIDHVFRRFDEDWLFVTYVFTSRHHHLKRVFTPAGR